MIGEKQKTAPPQGRGNHESRRVRDHHLSLGEADALIEKFISTPATVETKDVSLCPDCSGPCSGIRKGRNGASQNAARTDRDARPNEVTIGSPLAPEEITEQGRLIADLLGGGYEID